MTQQDTSQSGLRLGADAPVAGPPYQGGYPRLPGAFSGQSFWGRVMRLNARLEDSWVGDVLAGICVAILVIFTPFIIWGLQ